jgi:hypothetical protein
LSDVSSKFAGGDLKFAGEISWKANKLGSVTNGPNSFSDDGKHPEEFQGEVPDTEAI